MTSPTGREAYREAAGSLADYAREATPEQLTTVADEMLAVSGLLTREPRLRRALADPARTGGERVDLVRGLLAGKLGDQSVDLVAALVGQRWGSAAELLDAVERVGVDALLAAADRAGELGEVEDELFRFGQVVDGSPELAATLADPTAPVEHRERLVENLLAGKARDVTVRLTKLALTGFGGRNFAASLTRMVELAAAKRDSQVAYVTVAAPLSEADEQRLGAALAQMYGRSVSVKVTVDPEIIGGLSVRIGSDLYDGTVLHRLVQARTALTK